jgi:DNA-binding beta-propeller fold protein YncE
MVPHSHLALVTPGGLGTINGIDVTKSSSQLPIKSVTLTSGLVTAQVDLPTGQTLGLNPGNPGTVLIQGIPITSNNTNFNGAFTVQSVLNSTTFTYALNASANDSATCPTDTTAPTDLTKNPCDVYFSSPNLTIGLSQTSQGIAINPITRTAAIADANATGTNGAQINLLNSLDQSISSIVFHAGCTVYSTTCAGAPELLGTSSVSFQPYSNLLVSYNPQQNQVSVSNPVNQGRYALISAGSVNGGVATITPTVNGTPVSLNLFGGVAVDPATNQAFVVQSGSGTIQIVNLGPASSTTLKSAQLTELQVPTVSGAVIGGIAGALMPQGTLTSTTALANVQIYGSGFDSSTQVRLDGTALASGNVQFVSNRNLTVTIPASPFLSVPHHFAVDVVNGSGVRSNVTDFFVIKSVNLTTACSGGNPLPSSVAIADQLPGQAFAPIAVVSNSGCNNVSVIDVDPQSATFGTIKSSIATGGDPQGVAVSPRFGLAVVANNTDGTASVLDLITGTQKVAAVTVGSTPTGVAINEGTGAALVANTGSNTVSEIDLASLFTSTPATSLTAITIAVDTSPIAVAIDPDRGTNNRGLAVVSALQLVSGSSPIGVLDAIDIGGASPAKSTTAAVGTVTATPTGVVFNPTVSPALFYATSSGGNVVTTFNPDTGSSTSTHVGINPTSLAINPQTGGIMTVNSSSQTVSIIDSISNPFKTRSSFGLGGSPQFGVAIDQFTNLAVLADQANNRLLIFPVPN